MASGFIGDAGSPVAPTTGPYDLYSWRITSHPLLASNGKYYEIQIYFGKQGPLDGGGFEKGDLMINEIGSLAGFEAGHDSSVETIYRTDDPKIVAQILFEALNAGYLNVEGSEYPFGGETLSSTWSRAVSQLEYENRHANEIAVKSRMKIQGSGKIEK